MTGVAPIATLHFTQGYTQIGLATRAGAPAPVVSRLRTEPLRTIQAADVRGKLEGFDFDVQGSTAEEMRNRVSSEIQQWKKIIAEAGIEQQP